MFSSRASLLVIVRAGPHKKSTTHHASTTLLLLFTIIREFPQSEPTTLGVVTAYAIQYPHKNAPLLANR